MSAELPAGFTLLACRASAGIINQHSNIRVWYPTEAEAVDAARKIFAENRDCPALLVVRIAGVVTRQTPPVSYRRVRGK